MADIYIVDNDLADPEYAQAMEEMHYWVTITNIVELVKEHGLTHVMTDVQAALDRVSTPVH